MNTTKQTVLAAAQIASERENIRGNIEKHLHFIETASKFEAGLILFPEMSLTGYERELAVPQSIHAADQQLLPIRKLAAEKRITAVVGAPCIVKDRLYITSLLIQPSGEVKAYAKRYLHPGEELFFCPGAQDESLLIGSETVSFAICYDIEIPEHQESAAKMNSTVYAASIFYRPVSIPAAHEKLREHARNWSMSVLMSNFCGKCWDIESGGGSIFIDPGGSKIAECSSEGEGLVIVRKAGDRWTGECVHA